MKFLKEALVERGGGEDEYPIPDPERLEDSLWVEGIRFLTELSSSGGGEEVICLEPALESTVFEDGEGDIKMRRRRWKVSERSYEDAPSSTSTHLPSSFLAFGSSHTLTCGFVPAR